MKKILYMLVILLASFLIIDYNEIKASETNIPDWEFHPYGMNYLNRNNSLFSSEEVNVFLVTDRYIKIKGDTNYIFNNYLSNNALNTGLYIYEYNKSKHQIKYSNFPFNYNDEYIEFSTLPDTEYIRVNLDLLINDDTLNDYYLIDKYYILCENIYDPKDYSNEELVYQGANKSEYEFLGSDVELKYNINVNDPIKYDILKNYFKAFDNYDGNITDKINVVKNDYLNYENKIGNYSIIYEVTDVSQNKSRLSLNITVFDNTKPQINGNSLIRTNPINHFNVDELKTTLTAIDNYDGDISSKIRIVSDNYTSNKNKLGSYNIVYEVSDTSGNETNFNINIIVEDLVKPVISGQNYYEIGIDELLTVEDISSRITALDDVDGVLMPTIYEEDFSKNYHKVGTFFISYRVQDSAGNNTYYMVRVVVKDNIPPVFVIEVGTINISKSAKRLSSNEIVSIMKDYYMVDIKNDYQIISNNYDESFDSGCYEIVVKSDNSQFRLKVNVIEDGNEKKSSKDDLNTDSNKFDKFFRKVGNFFKKIWNSIF